MQSEAKLIWLIYIQGFSDSDFWNNRTVRIVCGAAKTVRKLLWAVDIMHTKSFRSLAPGRVTRQVSNSKCDISPTKCRRMMKFCLSVYDKIHSTLSSKTQKIKYTYICFISWRYNSVHVSIRVAFKFAFLVKAMLFILNFTIHIMVTLSYDNSIILTTG